MQTVDRIVAVLSNVAWADEGLTLSAICDRTGLAPASAHRIVQALGQDGLLERDAGTRRWRIGQGLARLAGTVRPTAGASIDIEEHVWWLIRCWPEAWHMAILSDGEVTCTFAAAPEASHRDTPRRLLGERLALHATAPARAILSQLGTDNAQRLLASVHRPTYTRRTVTGLEELAAELEVARVRGHAWLEHERVPGVAEIAVAIPGPPGEPPRSLGVLGPASRMRRHLREGLVASLAVSAADLAWGAAAVPVASGA